MVFNVIVLSTCGTAWSAHRTNRKRDAETETLLRGSTTKQTDRDTASETERNSERQKWTDRDGERRTETGTANRKRQRECRTAHRETETLLRRSNEYTDRETASETKRNRQTDRN